MSLLSFDVETALIQPGLLTPPIVCGAFAGPYRKLCNRNDTFVEVAEQMTDPSFIWTGANIAYDFGCVLAVRPDLLPLIWKAYEEGRVFDVLIAATLNAIAEGRLKEGDLYRRDGSKVQSGRYSLQEVVKEWLGRDDAKKNDRWRESYALLEDVPLDQWPEDARQYPIDDVVNTLEVAEAQLKGAKNLIDLPRQAHAAFAIHLGAVWGLRTDAKRVSEFEASVRPHIESLQAFALEHGLVRPKSKKPDAPLSKDMKAIRERVLRAYGGNPPTTEKGEVSTSREALTDSGDPVLEKFAEISRWEKLATYIPALKEASVKPLNVKPNVLLSTGRTSYEGLVQLMPRTGGVRECFVARPGTVWSSVDYAAIEMSTLSQVCLWTVGWSELADAINADLDPHCILGADLIGLTYEDFYARYKAGDKGIKLIRQAGKAGNFGYPGMMGPTKFVIAQKKAGYSVCEWFFHDGKCGEKRIHEWRDEPLEMPLCERCVEQSIVVREKYLSRWKEIRPYWNWVMREIEANDAVTQFVSKRVRGSPHGPAAANTLFQGLAADGAKRAVVQLTKEMYGLEESPLAGSRLLIFAHDETILEIPEGVAHDAAMRQATVMVEKMREVVPDVKVKAEPALQYFWDKTASTVFDAQGRLIPCNSR